ncbi:MAG: SH3 domain-containing protein [Chloroflexota bacterium]
MSLFSTPTATQPPLAITIDGIGIGVYVQISGTGGDGLRLRREPGINSEVLFLGYESEVFKVVEGPREADGFTWWYLTAPYDEKRSGWAASSFLRVIDLNSDSQP